MKVTRGTKLPNRQLDEAAGTRFGVSVALTNTALLHHYLGRNLYNTKHREPRELHEQII